VHIRCHIIRDYFIYNSFTQFTAKSLSIISVHIENIPASSDNTYKSIKNRRLKFVGTECEMFRFFRVEVIRKVAPIIQHLIEMVQSIYMCV